jgi:ABC-2 type transport system ATP-binding protein
VQNFSKGMLQRIGLAVALIHEPELIFLDEPTSGLDPMGRRLVRDIIRAQRDRGATVFLNSHLLSEIEITCDEVVFIRDGEVVTSRDLRTANGEEVRVVVRARKLTPEAIAGLAPWSTSTLLEEEQLTLTTRSQDVLPDILRHLVAAGADVYQFTPQRLSLEDLFLKIMGEDRGL